MKRIWIPLLVAAWGAGPLVAQQVISAQAGLIHYTEGAVLHNGKPVEARGPRFPQLAEGDTLATELGRAEVLLNPGSFLRAGDNSRFRMVSGQLPAWVLELERGAFVLEIADVDPKARPKVLWPHGSLVPLKRGVYRVDPSLGQVRVFEGELECLSGDARLVLKKGRMLDTTSGLVARKFDRDQEDTLDLWSRRRASYLAEANLQAALAMGRQGRGSRQMVRGWWFYHPLYGLVTYVPAFGVYQSFYGFRFYSWEEAWAMTQAFRPTPPRNPEGEPGGWTPPPNYPTVAPTPAGTSGTVAAGSPVSTAEPAASTAPVSRESGDAAGRRR